MKSTTASVMFSLDSRLTLTNFWTLGFDYFQKMCINTLNLSLTFAQQFWLVFQMEIWIEYVFLKIFLLFGGHKICNVAANWDEKSKSENWWRILPFQAEVASQHIVATFWTEVKA